MKEKILTLIIGFLIGAIVTTAIFLIIDKVSNNNINAYHRRPEMFQNGPMMDSGFGGQRGEMPSDRNSDSNTNNGTTGEKAVPPTIPDENSSDTSTNKNTKRNRAVNPNGSSSNS